MKAKQKTYADYLREAGYKESFIKKCNKDSYGMIGMKGISKVQKAFHENTTFQYKQR